MEALAAVGLASNVLQFVEFATKIVKTSNELRQDATSFENRDHAAVAAHLGELAQKMHDEARAAEQTAGTPSPEEKAYQAVLEGCSDLAKQLLKRIEGCSAKQAQPTGLLRRTRRAFKCVWNKQEIADITTRLQNFRGEITAYCVYRIQKTQLEDRVNQPSRADFETVKAQVGQLGTSIEGLSLQQSTFGTNLGSSQRTTLEALSSLRNDNMQLVSGVEQATSAVLGQKILLQSLLQEALGKFRKEMLPLVKYEFHSVAEAELAKAHGLMLHEIRGMLFEQTQDRQSDNNPLSMENQQSCDETTNTGAVSREDISLCAMDRVLHDNGLPANRNPARSQERTTIVTYDTTWTKETAFANFRVRSRHTVSFDQQFQTTETYGIEAQVLPTSRCWFATGCEINFQRVSDTRGVPSWTWKQPQTYRVLDLEDEVFQSIGRNDIDTVRTMLSDKTMFPSDRDEDGWTPLHKAAFHGQLEICQALVQCGADPHAENRYGYTPILYAVERNKLKMKSRLLESEICLCLGQVQQELEPPKLEDKLCDLAFVAALQAFPHDTLRHERSIHDWVSSIRLIGIYFQELNDIRFREESITRFGFWSEESGGLLSLCSTVSNATGSLAFQTAGITFNSLTNIISRGDEMSTRINVSIATFRLAITLQDARRSGALHTSAEDGHEFAYRGFFVDEDLWASLKFLDTVISNGIDAHPDSIFDTYRDKTIYDRFWDAYLEEVWEDILKERGFDPDWALEEDERRKEIACGKATGHDAEVEVPASQALEVKRRRAYAVDDDA